MSKTETKIKESKRNLSVGYPIFWGITREDFVEAVQENSDRISEVYFSWPEEPSGRKPTSFRECQDLDVLIQTMVTDLQMFHDMGIKLNLLLNCNCYGDEAIAPALAERLLRLLDSVNSAFPLSTITTTSPFLARTIKSERPYVSVRASVNMKITTVQAMHYLSEHFDEFCFHHDVNRDVQAVRKLSEWCDANEKSLCMLANSGCVSFCPTGIFHDNWLAHFNGKKNVRLEDADVLACRIALKSPTSRWQFLGATWIRPEDITYYDTLVSTVKLATRTRKKPHLPIRAYSNRDFCGNLLEILEPSHLTTAPDWVIDNKCFPPEWFHRVRECQRDCQSCCYCKHVYETVSNITAKLPESRQA